MAGGPRRMASRKSVSQPEGETRLAPDPFTAVLPALAALGAIASIATINWTAQERTPAEDGHSMFKDVGKELRWRRFNDFLHRIHQSVKRGSDGFGNMRVGQ